VRVAPLLLAAGLLAGGTSGCSDDAEPEPPPVTGTEEAFCVELRTAITEDSTIFDPLQPASPEDTEAATAALADAAPAEVAEPMRLLADTFAAVAGVLEAHDPADPEAAQAIEDLDLDQEAIGSAQATVLTYARDTCSIDVEAINAASVTTTTGVVTTLPPATTAPATTAPPVTG
jgi:hypothetical protein